MKEQGRHSIRELLADNDLIGKAIARGAREALERHAQAGNLIAVWRDCKVVWISAQELLDQLPDETAG